VRFGGVGEGAADEVQDVFVGEAVEDVFPGAAAGDELLGAEEAELLRDRGEARVGGLGELGDAPFAGGEAGQEAKPRHVAGGAEDGGGALEILVGSPQVDGAPGGMLVGAASIVVGGRVMGQINP
jgi:hypothetical protein